MFRGRLMFPIYDLRGDPVGFGGRKLEGIDRQVTNNPDAKYVNSADSILYHKGSLLFGLDRARKNISETSPAVIVEGYTDVIAMHQAGITTAIATCGTALGDGHFDLLRRFSERVVLAFDSDEAGSRAALRGDQLDTPFRLDLDLRVAVMPDGLDPADLVQEGRGEELVVAVTAARPLLEHRIDHEVAKFDLERPEGRARALHAAAASFARSSDGIARRRVHAISWRDGWESTWRLSKPRWRSARSRSSPGRPTDRQALSTVSMSSCSAWSWPTMAGLDDLSTVDFLDQRLARGICRPRTPVELTPRRHTARHLRRRAVAAGDPSLPGLGRPPAGLGRGNNGSGPGTSTRSRSPGAGRDEPPQGSDALASSADDGAPREAIRRGRLRSC